MGKPVCTHFHIFKNAGSTIDWILKRNFSIDALQLDDHKSPGNTYRKDEILDYLDKHPAVKSLSSHQMRFPLPQSHRYHFLPMLFIRHPVDRAYSIYSFKRTEVRTAPCILKAKTSSFMDFIQYNLKSKMQIMKNFQTLVLSHQDNKAKVTGQDLHTAMQNLKSCYVMGVVDRMDESLVVGEETLRKYFQDIDLSYISQNVNSTRTGTLAEKIESIRLELGDDVMREFIRANALDLQLYSYANKELDNRLKNIEDLEKRLQRFTERCQTHLQKNVGLSFKSIIGDNH